jgi:hypothetical protein
MKQHKTMQTVQTHLNKIFDIKKTMLCRDVMVEITKVNIELGKDNFMN